MLARGCSSTRRGPRGVYCKCTEFESVRAYILSDKSLQSPRFCRLVRRPRPLVRENTMKLPRRTLLYLASGAAALPALSRLSRAQAYPSRPVRIVVGFAPGGPNDINARLIGQWLSERLGQQFIVDNRPGASGNIAMESVVKAPPDGYTLVMVATSSAANATLYDKLPFVFLRDIAPIGTISRNYFVLVVHPSLPVTTASELIAYAKANPGQLNMGSPGSGTGPHMAGELFKMMAGVRTTNVPYRGSAPMLTDLLGGQVQCA